MPSNDTASAAEQIRREKTARRFYETRLAGQAAQIAHLARNRSMLRRGAYKQQDGTLGQPSDPAVEEEPVNIRIGDEIHHHAVAPMPEKQSSLLAKLAPWLLAGTLGAGATGIPWLLSSLQEKPIETVVDTDTQYILELLPGE